MNFIRRYWLLLLVALPFFVALDDSSVWDSNEAFYVQTPREMLQRGDWLVPYFNGQPRLNKPPLSYWVVAPFYAIFSASLFWERLVMALLAYGCVLAVFAVGRILYTHQVALLAAGIFATTFRFLILARRLLIDTLLLFCLLWAIAYFLWWLTSQRKSHFLLSATFFGLAFLSKGPVAILPILFLALYLFWTGRLGQLAQAPWAQGGAIYLFLCSFWFILLGVYTGWEPVIGFFLEENISRFASLEMGPRRGVFYYVGVFLGDFFPWSFFFVAAAVGSLWGKRPRPEHALLLGLWIVSYFLVFSLSYNKQEYYILPLYPAAALWIAHYLDQGLHPRALTASVGGILLVLGGALLVMAQVLFGGLLMWIPLLFLPVVVVGLFKNRCSMAIACLALFYASSFFLYMGPWEEYKPVHHLARTMSQKISQAGSGDEIDVGYYKLASPSLAFYLNRPIVELSDPKKAAALLDSERVVYLIVSSQDYQELADASRRPLKIVEARPKLYTTGRNLIEGFRRGSSDNLRNNWIRPVYLISNAPGG
ncbi:MAG: glycosyltransferase family 39 protein [Acidobacteriota bacterium]